MIKAIIHCSDSPQGRGDNAETIHGWHLENGWDGIGYHYVILENGMVENGRPEYWKGSHASGHNNSIGICLIGKKDFTVEQYQALTWLLKSKNWKANEIVGHYEVSPRKTCPNFDVEDYLASVNIT